MRDLRDIVREHGGDLYAGGRAAIIPGPHHSRRDRSLSLRLSDDGERVIFHSFAGDDCRDIMKHLGLEARHSQEATPAERAKLKRLRDEERRKQATADRALCQHIWAQTLPIEGSLAEAYLWGRSLILDGVGDQVRFHPAAPRGKPRAEGMPPLPTPHPAMVALVRDANGYPISLHLTFLALDGSGKAFGDRSRLMFGAVAEHSAQLSPIGPDRVLAVGEGIETSAAYRALKGVPTWATLSTSGLQRFVLPSRLRKLIIAADSDKGGMGAAQVLAERACKVCDVEIDQAPAGQDWADVWAATHV